MTTLTTNLPDLASLNRPARSAFRPLPQLPALADLGLAKNAMQPAFQPAQATPPPVASAPPNPLWSGDEQTDGKLLSMAQDADTEFANRRPATPAQVDRRKQPRLDPEDPATYEKLQPTIQRVAEQSSGFSSFLDGLGKVLDVVDVPRMAVNKILNTVVGAKASSPDPSIIGGDRIYGADVMARFGIQNRAAQLIGGFLWDVVTDPLTWVTGIGGIVRSTGKLAIGKVVRPVLRSTMKAARTVMVREGEGGALRLLAEKAGLELRSLESVTEAANAAGRADELGGIIKSAAKLEGEEPIVWATRAAEAEKKTADLLTTIGKEDPDAIGNVFSDILQRGNLERKGLQVSTEPLRNFPILGRAFKWLPEWSSNPLTAPGLAAGADRVAGAIYGGLTGAAVGNVQDEAGPGMFIGAGLGALAGRQINRAMLRSANLAGMPARLAEAGGVASYMAKGRVALRDMFSHAPPHEVGRLEEQFRRMTQAANYDTLESLPEKMQKELERFRTRLNGLGLVDREITTDEAARILTAGRELGVTRPDAFDRAVYDVLIGPQEGEGNLYRQGIIEMAAKYGRQPADEFKFVAPEIHPSVNDAPPNADHLIVPTQDGKLWRVFRAIDDEGRINPQPLEQTASLDDALREVANRGGKPVVLEWDDAAKRYVSPEGKDWRPPPPEAPPTPPTELPPPQPAPIAPGTPPAPPSAVTPVTATRTVNPPGFVPDIIDQPRTAPATPPASPAVAPISWKELDANHALANTVLANPGAYDAEVVDRAREIVAGRSAASSPAIPPTPANRLQLPSGGFTDRVRWTGTDGKERTGVIVAVDSAKGVATVGYADIKPGTVGLGVGKQARVKLTDLTPVERSLTAPPFLGEYATGQNAAEWIKATHPNIDADTAKVAAGVLRANAKAWAAETGQPAEEYYKRYRYVFEGGEAAQQRVESHPLYAGAFVEGRPPRGFTQVDEQARMVIGFLKSAGRTTPFHELGHAFLYVAADAFPESGKALRRWLKLAPDAAITIEHEERIASAFERYLADGFVPEPQLRTVFERVKQWLIDTYRSIRGTRFADDIPTEVRSVFDKWLGGGLTPELTAKLTTAEAPHTANAARALAGRVASVPLSELHTDPRRFQYKLGVNEAGVSSLLKDVKRFDPEKAGVIGVWFDPADSKIYVVNGHHRYDLARKSGQANMNVLYLDAKDAAEARAKGALINIGEGRGTSIDAAKIIRDRHWTAADLEAAGLSMRESKAAEGVALSQLSDPLFNEVIKGHLTEARGAVIGRELPDPAAQAGLWRLMQTSRKAGNLSTDELSELIGFVKGSGTVTTEEASLFGIEQVRKSYAVEKAKLSAEIKDRFGKDKRLFGFVAKTGRAEELARGGNVIDATQSGGIAKSAELAGFYFDKLKTQIGPVSAALNDAAEKLAKGGNRKEIADALYARVKQLVEDADKEAKLPPVAAATSPVVKPPATPTPAPVTTKPPPAPPAAVAPPEAPPASPFATQAAKAESRDRAQRLRKMADYLQGQIDDKRRAMTQNPTPKRMKEYRTRTLDADDLERAQKAMRALADAHEAGTVPPELSGIKNKDDLLRMTRKRRDYPSYYTVLETPDYVTDDKVSQALRKLTETAETPAASAERQAAAKASKIAQMEAEVQFQKLPGFFPTPSPIVHRMVRESDIRDGMTVLEPSAGKGDIAEGIRQLHPEASVAVVEQSPKLQEILRHKGFEPVGSDFLEHGGQYDRIVMNPPFEQGADIEHVRHAFDLLKPGGRVVAIMSEGPFFRADRKATEFRQWLESVGGSSEKLEEGAFKSGFRPTGVATRIVTIDKPGAVADVGRPGLSELESKWGDVFGPPPATSHGQPNAESGGYRYEGQAPGEPRFQPGADAGAIRFEGQLYPDRPEAVRPGEGVPGADRGGGPGGRPGIRLAGAEHLPTPRPIIGADRYPSTSLDEHQRFGANLALSRFERGPKAGRGFLLADGTGVGKTREELAIADHMLGATGKPVLILTQNRQTIKGNFAAAAAEMGLDLGKFEVDTYDALRAGTAGKGDYGLVIFDEAHNLKNTHALKSIAAGKIKTEHVLHATATPMDRPIAASYFMSDITGVAPAEIQRRLGFEVIEQYDSLKQMTIPRAQMLPGHNYATILDNLIGLRDMAVRAGAMIRREYPFYGEITARRIDLGKALLDEQNKIIAYYDAMIASSRNPRVKANYSGQKTQALSRWVESQKRAPVYTELQKELDEGRSVIVIGENINQSHIKGANVEVPGLLTTLGENLDRDNIRYAQIFGGGDKGKAVKLFQDNRVRVALATPQSGGVGIDLDDAIGAYPRTMLIATANFSGDVYEQTLGRVSRRNTASPARVVFVQAPASYSDQRRIDITTRKIETMRKIQAGEDLDRAIGINPEDLQPGAGGPRFEPATPEQGKLFGASGGPVAGQKQGGLFDQSKAPPASGGPVEQGTQQAGRFGVTADDMRVAQKYQGVKVGHMVLATIPDTFALGVKKWRAGEKLPKIRPGEFSPDDWAFIKAGYTAADQNANQLDKELRSFNAGRKAPEGGGMLFERHLEQNLSFGPQPGEPMEHVLRMAPPIDPELNDVMTAMQARNAEQFARAKAAGVPLSAMDSEEVGYVHHELAKAESLWDSLKRLVTRLRGKKEGFQMMRKWRDRSIEEINAIRQAGGRPDLFTHDPVLYESMLSLAHNRAMGNAMFLREVADRYGVKLAENATRTPEGMVKLTGLKSKFFTPLERYAFTPDVADYLTRVDKTWQRPGPLLEAFDKVMSSMKGLMLIAPAFHIRNLGTNIWNSAAGEGFSVSGLVHGIKARLSSAAGIKTWFGRAIEGLANPETGRDFTYHELMRELNRHGMVSHGFYATEIGSDVRELLASTGAASAKQKLKPWQIVRLNRVVGSVIEDGSKIGHVITRMKRGDTLTQAIASADKYLFDYSKLTPFERSAMRRIFPFYTWARNNTALQLELLAERPEWTAIMPKVKGNVEASLGQGQVVPAALRPDYARDESGIQLTGGLKPAYLNLPAWVGQSELKYLAPGGAVRGAVDQLNPIIKTPIELAQNKDWFSDRPIRSYPGQTQSMAGIEMSPELAHILGPVRPLSEVNRIAGGVERGEGPAEVAGRLTGLRVLQGNLPRQIGAAERQQAEARGYMRANARTAIANSDFKKADTIAGLFEQQGSPEEAVKTRIQIAQAQGDTQQARQLALALAVLVRQRKAREVPAGQVRQLGQSIQM